MSNQLIKNSLKFIHLYQTLHLCFISKRTSGIALADTESRKLYECNHLWVLIRKLPGYWHLGLAARNSYTTLDKIPEVLSNSGLSDVSIELNPNISIEQFIASDAKPGWDWDKILGRPRTSLSTISKYIYKIPDDAGLYHLSTNKNLTMEFVASHDKRKWAYLSLCINPGISFFEVIYLLLKMKVLITSQHLGMLSSRSDINYSYVNSYVRSAWNWDLISRNAQMDVLNAYPHFPWNLDGLQLNLNLTHAVALKFGLSYDFRGIPIEVLKSESLYHPNKSYADYLEIYPWDLFNKYPYSAWNIDLLVKWYMHYPGDIIKRPVINVMNAHPDFKWDMKIMSKYVISYEDVLDNPQYEWDKSSLSLCHFSQYVHSREPKLYPN